MSSTLRGSVRNKDDYYITPVDGNMIKKPRVGMYVFKRHKKSGRYLIGKIILVDNYPINDCELLVIDLIECNDYEYMQKSSGKYEGCACIYTYTPNGYEIMYGKNHAEIIAKVI